MSSPTATVLEELGRAPCPSLDALGGETALLAELDVVSASALADRAVDALLQAQATTSLAQVAGAVIERNPHPPVVAGAISALAAADWPAGLPKALQTALFSRLERRSSAADAVVASECLAGAYLFAAAEKMPPFRLLAALTECRAQEELPVFLRRAARVTGLAHAAWDVPELVQLLDAWSEDEESGDEAYYERSVIALRDALLMETEGELLAHLRAASDRFAALVDWAPERLDAHAFSVVLAGVVAFLDAGSTVNVDAAVQHAAHLFGMRHDLLDRTSLRSWLTPRVDYELAWHQLGLTIHGLAGALARPSWLQAVPLLQQLLQVSVAAVSVGEGRDTAWHRALASRIETAFVTREGLRAHLSDWLDSDGPERHERSAADALRARIEQQIAELGKTADPAARQPLGSETATGAEDEAIQRVWAIQVAYLRQHKPLVDANVARLHERVRAALAAHPDYAGSVQVGVDVLILSVLGFLVYCLDIGQAMAGPDYSFLFARPNDAPHFEVALQRALHPWLKAGLQLPHHAIQAEPNDVAQGRADIAVSFPDHRVVLELKRELTDGSREGVRQYLGQAAAYQVTSTRISFLVYLDLSTATAWTPSMHDHVWVEQVATPEDSAPRNVIVVRIPGNRRRPSDTETPASPDSAGPKRRTSSPRRRPQDPE